MPEKESKLYLLKHKENGKFLHRKYKSNDARKHRSWREGFGSKLDYFCADNPIDAAMYPSISAIKNSFYGWGKWDKVPEDIARVTHRWYMKRPGTEWFDEMDVYVLHPCIAGKVQLEKYEGVICT